MNFTPVSMLSRCSSSLPKSSAQEETSELHADLYTPRSAQGQDCDGDDKLKSIVDEVAKSSVLAQGVLPTPPLSVILSTKNCGSAHVTEAPLVPDTCGTDPLLVPTKENDKRRARPKTRVGRSQAPRTLHKHSAQGGAIHKPHHISLPPVHRTTRRRAAISPSGTSRRPNVMAPSLPSAYTCNIPSSDYDLAECLSEGSSQRTAPTRQFYSNILDSKCINILGLDLYSSPSVYSDLHLPSPSSEHQLHAGFQTPTNKHVRRLSSLHIMIPQPMRSQPPSISPPPVTALWFPRSGAGDICPSPPEESFSFPDSQFPEDDTQECATSYHNATPEEAPFVQAAAGGELALLAGDPVAHSPRSPPPLLRRRRYIPLPPLSPDALEDPRRSSPIEASFRMMQLHDGSRPGIRVVRGCLEQLSDGTIRLVANLPQECGAELLSPLPLATAPSLRLEDLEECLSHCLDAVDWLQLVCSGTWFYMIMVC